MKRKFNIIDIFIILAAFFVLVGVGVRIYISETVEKSNITEYTLTLRSDGIGVENDDMIKTGDKVMLNDGEVALGTVLEASYKPHKTYMLDSENKYTEVIDSGKLDLVIKVTVLGEMTEDGFMLNGEKYLSAGMEVAFITENYQGKGMIMGITNEK